MLLLEFTDFAVLQFTVVVEHSISQTQTSATRTEHPNLSESVWLNDRYDLIQHTCFFEFCPSPMEMKYNTGPTQKTRYGPKSKMQAEANAENTSGPHDVEGASASPHHMLLWAPIVSSAFAPPSCLRCLGHAGIVCTFVFDMSHYESHMFVVS